MFWQYGFKKITVSAGRERLCEYFRYIISELMNKINELVKHFMCKVLRKQLLIPDELTTFRQYCMSWYKFLIYGATLISKI